jgi:hypothetical protein
MTTQTENKTTQLPAFYIYEQGEDALVPVGRAYKHNTGNGINILLDGKRFVAFPPKAKTEIKTDAPITAE